MLSTLVFQSNYALIGGILIFDRFMMLPMRARFDENTGVGLKTHVYVPSGERGQVEVANQCPDSIE